MGSGGCGIGGQGERCNNRSCRIVERMDPLTDRGACGLPSTPSQTMDCLAELIRFGKQPVSHWSREAQKMRRYILGIDGLSTCQL